MNALLPCPLCAGPDRFVEAVPHDNYAECCDCGARSGVVIHYPAKDAEECVAEKWNKRAEPKAISEGALVAVFNKLSALRSKSTTQVDRAKRKVANNDLLIACGYAGDPDAELINAEALLDAYGDAASMVHAMLDALRENNREADNVPF